MDPKTKNDSYTSPFRYDETIRNELDVLKSHFGEKSTNKTIIRTISDWKTLKEATKDQAAKITKLTQDLEKERTRMTGIAKAVKAFMGVINEY